jgi:hypothetical protein
MKEGASKPNGNENHLNHHILSWCGDHKMKVIIGGVLINS